MHTRSSRPGTRRRRQQSGLRQRKRAGDQIPPVVTKGATSSPDSRPTSFATATPKPSTLSASNSWIRQAPLIFRSRRCRRRRTRDVVDCGGCLQPWFWSWDLSGPVCGVTLFLNRDRESVDDKYLAALRQSGLSGEFNSDANAVAHGKHVCRQLEDGARQQGMPVDQVAVDYYCPQFSRRLPCPGNRNCRRKFHAQG